ncbi:MAG: PEP/pyruvate-binding domain-containing protein [Methylotenera sp.]|nr:PEP/pyruvate-binding domain-containing protein [Methylotenera sp.]
MNILKFATVLSLTIIFTTIFIGPAQARRVNPASLEQSNVPSNTIETDNETPVGFRFTTCPLPNTPHPTSTSRVWESEVTDLATWQRLSNTMRGTEYSKFVIDLKTNKIYFVDSHVFTLHVDFVLDYLQKLPRTAKNLKAYNHNYSTRKPQFILGYLTHYPKLTGGELWTFSFWEGDTIQAKDIRLAYKCLQKTFTVGQVGSKVSLKFRPDSSAQEAVAKQLVHYGITSINNNQIYQALPYQAFNTGNAIGRLFIVPSDTKLETLTFSDDDIVLLQTSYPDISPVAGIITTRFSTPLSHVNLRAAAWGIPNASIKNANNDFKELDKKWVSYGVQESGYTLKQATDEEVTQHKNAKLEKAKVVMQTADLTSASLLPLNRIRAEDASQFGAKTANLGEIVHADLASVNIPDGFGIPFSYYLAHIQKNGLDQKIQRMLNVARFSKDAIWRKKSLQTIRQAISSAPIDEASMQRIVGQWQSQLNGSGVFVRSSTNAEDLKGFNGAGLYDTVPNVKDRAALQAAIKQVWASVWNLRAVQEREHFGIPHNKVFPAVLIQKAVNATAAGVLLTTDIWGHQPRTYTINAKWGLGMRVVEGQKIAEQILFDTGNEGTRVISRSDESTMLIADPNGGIIEKPVEKGAAILTEQRAKLLADSVDRVAEVFNQIDILDIEWVLENKNGKDVFWIVQARPYISGPNNSLKQ